MIENDMGRGMTARTKSMPLVGSILRSLAAFFMHLVMLARPRSQSRSLLHTPPQRASPIRASSTHTLWSKRLAVDIGSDDTVIVGGGGLSAAQAILLASRRCARKVVHVSAHRVMLATGSELDATKMPLVRNVSRGFDLPLI